MTQNKVWNICDPRAEHGEEIDALAKALGLRPLTCALLWNRGQCDEKSAAAYIRKETEYFHDAFLLRDMDAAVARIKRAVDDRERIVIYGDYDVDGVTSVSALYLFLADKGADVGYYIPSRTGEGYGVNNEAVERLADEGAALIITVDTGVTAIDEIAHANSLGVDVVVTDHHECHAELPPAVAVVNPRRPDCDYPFKELAGVGVVFKLLCALEQTYDKIAGIMDNYIRNVTMKYSDLIAIGTVADVMPLTDENRLIVSCGMALMEKRPRPAIEALLEMSGNTDNRYKTPKKKKITSSLIGYTIAPRINAAGRITNASKAVEMFLSSSDMKVRKIADELCETNRRRQEEENSIIEQAYRKIEEEHDFTRDSVIVLAEDDWHSGVIGIVASRITEHYNLPSILISFDGDVGKGSGRSVRGLNLVDALKSCGDCLIKYGGHALAAGLSIERSKLDEFRRRINDFARENFAEDTLDTSMSVDCEVGAGDITLAQASELYLLEPYGVSNPVPVFALRDAVINEITPIGGGRHTKMSVSKDGAFFTALCFGISPDSLDYLPGDIADFVFNMEINEFQNNQSVQLNVRAIAHCSDYIEQTNKARDIYTKAVKGDNSACGLAGAAFPQREDFVGIYLYLKNEARAGRDSVTVHRAARALGCAPLAGYIKVRLIFDIMNETGLINAVRSDDTQREGGDCVRYVYRINAVAAKVDLTSSTLYKKIESAVKKAASE